MRISTVTLISFIAVSLLLTMGCAKKDQLKQSGFIENYPEFKEGPEDGVDFVYIREDVDFGKYDKVMMDNVMFYLSDESKEKGIDPEELKKLADEFHNAFAESLGDDYPLVEEPGEGVMRIRFAITELLAAKPALTLVTTAMPGGSAVKAAKMMTTGSHGFTGSTAMEAEILDSLSNERLAAAIDRRSKGKKIRLGEGLTKWGDVKDVFKYWAKRLRIFLDTAHGIKQE